MKTVILSLGDDDTVNQLIPYLDELIRTEDDEVLFAIAEEIGNVSEIMHDPATFLPMLETLAVVDETVVRDQAS